MNKQARLSPAAALLGALVLSGASAAPGPAPAAEDFAWLAGQWCLRKGETRIEEYWLPPRGYPVLGLGRTTKDGRTSSFEFTRIELAAGKVRFLASIDGEPAVPFELTASGRDWARFENPAHDFPKRVEYRRVPAGLHAEIGGPGPDGQERVIAFDYGAGGCN